MQTYTYIHTYIIWFSPCRLRFAKQSQQTCYKKINSTDITCYFCTMNWWFFTSLNSHYPLMQWYRDYVNAKIYFFIKSGVQHYYLLIVIIYVHYVVVFNNTLRWDITERTINKYTYATTSETLNKVCVTWANYSLNSIKTLGNRLSQTIWINKCIRSTQI